MTLRDNIVYSTKPIKLVDMINWQKMIAGDYEAMAALLISRTDLTPEEVATIDVASELPDVILKLSEAITRATQLAELSKQMPR